jgi:8-oxo-dGTP pyrophosphatase MutT (NUDIX family)
VDGNSFAGCAMRELFEEVGVVLDGTTGHGVDLDELRKKCTKDASEFARVKEVLMRDAASSVKRLKDFSHWITPIQEKWRYDTRFFVLHLSEEEAAMAGADENEVFSQVWAEPKEFLRRHQNGDIQVFFSFFFSFRIFKVSQFYVFCFFFFLSFL